jgi:Activator of Hsp90 ATPase homolog 1-like protein
MTEQATANVVRHSVTVPIPADRAFRLFTEEIGTWWPKDTHSLSDGPFKDVFETRLGGRWYELGEDGSECTVGTIVVWEPPARFVLAWQLTPEWKFEPDLDRATQVEVTFEPEAEAATRVTLEHRGFESYGESGTGMRESVGGEEGWPVLMQLYAEAAAA